MSKSYYTQFFIALLAMALVSCLPQHGRYGQEEEPIVSIPFTMSDSSMAFTQKQVRLGIDTFGRTLGISLHYDFPRNAAFPINKAFADTLTETAFLFELKADGQTILSDYSEAENGRGTNLAERPMLFAGDTVNLLTAGTAGISIPFYAFHHLKQGVHHMEVTISQNVFRSNHSTEIPCYDSVFKHPSTCRILNHAQKQLVRCTARFKIVVPALHHTVLCSNRIEVKNDSTFNPYASDNTIWKSPLPDVYWSVLYPLGHSYANSDYESSTIEYTRQDTVNLYHYSTTDSLCFAVYDHDGLSRDDGLGFRNFCLQDLIRRKTLNTTFWYIKLFSLDADYKGIVNP